jgi:hypothetical protein
LAFGQSTGELSGAVMDVSGAAVAGAELRLVHEQTNGTVTGVSNEAGLFRFGGLQPGTYALRVRRDGFAETTLTGLVAEVGRITRADVTVQVAAARQEIRVSAGAQLLDFDSGAKGQMIMVEEMKRLPIRNRNPLALLVLTPGVTAAGGGNAFTVVSSNGSGQQSRFTINGGVRTASGGFHEYLVDGISVTNRREGTIAGLPSPDALREFRVQSGGMSAEFGNTVGGVIHYATKSGSNDLHGTASWAHRNTVTNARIALPSTGVKQPNLFNVAGGSVGGPLVLPKVHNGRNTTFFHFAYEFQARPQSEPRDATIPTARFRNGDFSELPAPVFDPASAAAPSARTAFPGNVIPASRINPFGKKILDLYPQPSRQTLGNNFTGIRRTVQEVDNYTGRLDRILTDKHRVLFRATWVDPDAILDREMRHVDFESRNLDIPQMNYVANYTWTIRPTMFYMAAAGYVRMRRTEVDPSGNTIGAGFFGHTISPPETSSLSNTTPGARPDVYRAVGRGNQQNVVADTFQLNQSLAWVRGTHTFRYGADLRRYYYGGAVGGSPNGTFTFGAAQTGNGTASTGDTAASMILGLPRAVLIQRFPSLLSRHDSGAFYVQDDWRVSPRLTLNLGLRWDVDTPFAERHNRVGYFDTTGANSLVGLPGVYRYAGLNGQERNITSGDYNNIAPRIGFAWAPGASRRTTVRGAYGAYYAAIPGEGFFNAAPGFETTFQPAAPTATDPAVVMRENYALPAVQGPQGDAAYLGRAFTELFDRRLARPLVHQWNLGVQREIAQNLTVEVLYTGNRGTRLIDRDNWNLPPLAMIEEAIRQTGATGNPAAALNFLNARVTNPLAGRVPGTLGAATVTRAQAAAPYPHYTTTTTFGNTRDSVYHALQTTLQKRLTGDLNFMIAYTFSKLIDNVPSNVTSVDENGGARQNPYDFRDSRAVGAYDRSHTFLANVVYSLPFGKGKNWASSGFLSRIAGGFELSNIFTAYTGFPLGIYQSAANGLGLGGARPDVAGDPFKRSREIRGSVAPSGNVIWVDSASYPLVNGRFGTAPIREARLRGPGLWQLDLALQREFRVYERLALRFRAEAYNALNHTNWFQPLQNRSSAAFGQISQSHDPRLMQFGLEVAF